MVSFPAVFANVFIAKLLLHKLNASPTWGALLIPVLVRHPGNALNFKAAKRSAMPNSVHINIGPFPIITKSLHVVDIASWTSS